MGFEEKYTYNHFLQLDQTLGGTTNFAKGHVHLSYGYPYTNLFPKKELSEASFEATTQQGHLALHYFGGQGTSFLREWIINQLKKVSVDATPEQVYITAGAAQAIEVVGRVLLNPGDEVWLEKPSFFGAIRSFKLAGALIREFELDEDGLIVDDLQQELVLRLARHEKLPKLIYVMPNFQNPTGVTMSIERRKQLAELAKQYNIYILEDDAYMELNYTNEHLPSIFSFQPDFVVHIGTFSKIIAPGIRLGWALSSPKLKTYIRQFMHGAETNPYMQEITATFLNELNFESYLAQLKARYTENLDVMIKQLQHLFGDEIVYTRPKGGFFLSIQFRNDIDVMQLSKEAEQLGVSIVDGSAFYLDQQGRNLVRLCFTYCSAEQIKTGIERLWQAFLKLRAINLV